MAGRSGAGALSQAAPSPASCRDKRARETKRGMCIADLSCTQHCVCPRVHRPSLPATHAPPSSSSAFCSQHYRSNLTCVSTKACEYYNMLTPCWLAAAGPCWLAAPSPAASGLVPRSPRCSSQTLSEGLTPSLPMSSSAGHDTSSICISRQQHDWSTRISCQEHALPTHLRARRCLFQCSKHACTGACATHPRLHSKVTRHHRAHAHAPHLTWAVSRLSRCECGRSLWDPPS